MTKKEFYLELLASLEAWSPRKLYPNDFGRGGKCCALGVYAVTHGVEDPDEDFANGCEAFEEYFDLPVGTDTGEVATKNDSNVHEDPEQRYTRMVKWVRTQLVQS